MHPAGADRHTQANFPRPVTDTSRMFMMPTPPTISDIDATAASKSAMMRLLLSAVSAIWLRWRTVKSLISPGRMWWRCVRMSLTSSRIPSVAAKGCRD
jgi:hypothetical protein